MKERPHLARAPGKMSPPSPPAHPSIYPFSPSPSISPESHRPDNTNTHISTHTHKHAHTNTCAHTHMCTWESVAFVSHKRTEQSFKSNFSLERNNKKPDKKNPLTIDRKKDNIRSRPKECKGHKFREGNL